MKKYWLFKKLIVLLILISFQAIAQEKRLALVIGNSSYDKGLLKNPVNDALLISETLKSLGFDVILKTNIANIKEFNDAVKEFGERRNQYNVGFIYYAGHAVQIDNVNYLLATTEQYKTDYDVTVNAFSVQTMMRFLTDRSEEVNVLILDACRDNPFEKNWIKTSRSSDGGGGLAKINPPTGSLIAYSTDPGNTAADGDDKNSLYCMSLSKNMLLENTSLDQVFRNVRADVLAETNNKQRPVEATQLTGEAFYLKKSTYLKDIKVIDSLIELKDYTPALVKVTSILTLDPNNMQALLRKGRISYNTLKNKYDGLDLKKAAKLYPNAPEVFIYLYRYYSTIENENEAFKQLKFALQLDSSYAETHYWLARYYMDTENNKEALVELNKVIELNPKNASRYINRAIFYKDYQKDNNKALQDFSKASELDPENVDCLYNRGNLYTDYLLDDKSAIKDFEQMLKIAPDDINAINSIGLIYDKQGKLDLAIKEYEKGIALETTNPEAVAYCYSNRAGIYEKQNLLDKALADYSKAIELDPENGDRYYTRALFYYYQKDNNNALLDFTKAIELDPENLYYLHDRGILFQENILNDDSAIKDFEQILKIAPQHVDAINRLGLIYDKQGKLDLAIKEYEKGIALESTNPEKAAYCYSNRAGIYEKQNLLDKALADYSKAIELDPENGVRYYNRALFFKDNQQDNNKALLDFSKAIELDPENIGYLYDRGNFYTDYLSDDKSAIKDFEQVLKIAPDDIDAINSIGLIYDKQGKLDLAIKEYEKGIALETTNPEAAAYCYNNRAGIYTKQNLLDKALADYSKAIELDPKNGERYYNRAVFFQDFQKDNMNALLDFSKAIELAPENIKYLYARGVLYTDYVLDNKSAIKDFEQILKIEADNVDARNGIGLIYENQEKLDLAIKEYEKGILLESTNPESAAFCYNNRAGINVKQKLFDKALADYTKAIELDPDNGDRYFNRAIFFQYYLEDNKKALIDYSKAIELAPEELDYWNNRGQLYTHYLLDYKSAIKDFEQMLKIDPENIDAINSIGAIYDLQGKLDLSIKEYEKGIALETNNPEAVASCYSNRAGIYVKQKLLDKALADYSKAIKLDPENSFRYSSRGDFYKDRLNRPYDALVDYSLALATDSQSVYTWFQRGKLFSDHLNDHLSAIQDFKQILKLDSNDVVTLNWIGVFYARLLNEKLETEYYNKTISKDGFPFEDSTHSYINGIAWAYSNLAENLQTTQYKDKAQEFYTKAVKYDVKNPERYFWRGWFLALYQKNLDDAILDFNKAIDLDVKNPHWKMNRAMIYLKKGDTEKAKNDFDDAVKLSENSGYYIAERANYFSIIGEYKKANKDFQIAIKNDTTNRCIFHYYTENLIRQNKLQDALKLVNESIKRFDFDTVSYNQLGSIYLIQKEYIKALDAFQKASSIMEFNSGYRTIEPDQEQVLLSDVYLKMADIYRILEQKDLICAYYQKAISAIENEMRPDKTEVKNILKEQIIIYCNE